MPISLSTEDPYAAGVSIPTAWAYCSMFALDFASRSGRLVFDVHKDRDSAYAGKPPVRSVEYAITPTGIPAVYGEKPLISPYVPATYQQNVIRAPGTDGPDDPGEVEVVELTPAVDPVYGPAQIVKAAIPSFSDLVASQQQAYGLLLQAVDALALTQPEFAGGVEVD